MKQPKCKNCWDKGYFTQMRGEIGSNDFGGEGFLDHHAFKRTSASVQKVND